MFQIKKSFSKKIVIINLILISIVFLLARIIHAKNQSQNLNLIIISVDTLRADHMSLYGYKKNTTPNIDSWAKKAIVFDNFRAKVPMTYPSFNALFTGLDPYTTRISTNLDKIFNDNVETLNSILNRNGFYSSAFVTNGWEMESRFDLFKRFDHKYFYFDDNNRERYSINSKNGSKEVVEDATKWLKTNKKKKFYLWVHLVDPHRPYYPDGELKCKFNKKYCDRIKNKSLDELDSIVDKYQMCQEMMPPEEIVEQMQTLYDGEIAVSDNYVGKLLKSIEKLGLDKKSIVVFYGDHGEGFDHNYYFNHREVLYDSAVKIPLIIRLPNSTLYNRRSNIMIQNTDVLPTILDLMSIDRDAYKFDGTSFNYAINGGLIPYLLAPKRKYSYSVNSDWSKFSIFDGRYKYIYSFPGSCILDDQQEELYDIKNDPRESKNLILEGKNNLTLKKELLFNISRYNLPIKTTQFNDSFIEDKIQSKEQIERINSLGY